MKKTQYLTVAMFIGTLMSNTAFSADSSSTMDSNSSPMQMLANTQSTTPAASQPSTPELTTAAATTSSSVTSTVTQTSAATLDPPPAAVDCNYTLSGSPSEVNPDIIVQWANYAAMQTFTYDFQNYDKQFQALKHCYTTAGWESFMEAMKASNNLKAAQEEHLFVTAKIDGQSQVVSQATTQEGQPSWTVRVPIKVIYQNQDREVSQDMYVDLTIKTIYGVPTHLGINQIIASPKSETPPASSGQNEPTQTMQTQTNAAAATSPSSTSTDTSTSTTTVPTPENPPMPIPQPTTQTATAASQ